MANSPKASTVASVENACCRLSLLTKQKCAHTLHMGFKSAGSARGQGSVDALSRQEVTVSKVSRSAASMWHSAVTPDPLFHCNLHWLKDGG